MKISIKSQMLKSGQKKAKPTL